MKIAEIGLPAGREMRFTVIVDQLPAGASAMALGMVLSIAATRAMKGLYGNRTEVCVLGDLTPPPIEINFATAGKEGV